MHTIQWEDFEKVDMRVGTIVHAESNTGAKKPAYILHIDFGELGIRKSSAQITELYSPSDLLGKQIIAVLNFTPKQIGKFTSECLVMGIVGEQDGVVLITPDRQVANGHRLA